MDPEWCNLRVRNGLLPVLLPTPLSTFPRWYFAHFLYQKKYKPPLPPHTFFSSVQIQSIVQDPCHVLRVILHPPLHECLLISLGLRAIWAFVPVLLLCVHISYFFPTAHLEFKSLRVKDCLAGLTHLWALGRDAERIADTAGPWRAAFGTEAEATLLDV